MTDFDWMPSEQEQVKLLPGFEYESGQHLATPRPIDRARQALRWCGSEQGSEVLSIAWFVGTMIVSIGGGIAVWLSR